jgi:hypothetical protein
MGCGGLKRSGGRRVNPLLFQMNLNGLAQFPHNRKSGSSNNKPLVTDAKVIYIMSLARSIGLRLGDAIEFGQFPPACITNQQAEVEISLNAFTTPGWLASSISHEVEGHAHYHTGKNFKTDPKGKAAQEVEAYGWEIKNAKRFGLSPKAIKNLEDKRDEEAQKVKEVEKKEKEEKAIKAQQKASSKNPTSGLWTDDL